MASIEPAPVVSAADASAEQQASATWPLPGQEGFVHPDGTPQSVAQLTDNQQAAADRAAAGSAVHGAPATGGIPPAPVTDPGKPADEAAADHTAWVEAKRAQIAAEAAIVAADAADTAADQAEADAEAKVEAGVQAEAEAPVVPLVPVVPVVPVPEPVPAPPA